MHLRYRDKTENQINALWPSEIKQLVKHSILTPFTSGRIRRKGHWMATPVFQKHVSTWVSEWKIKILRWWKWKIWVFLTNSFQALLDQQTSTIIFGNENSLPICEMGGKILTHGCRRSTKSPNFWMMASAAWSYSHSMKTEMRLVNILTQRKLLTWLRKHYSSTFPSLAIHV